MSRARLGDSDRQCKIKHWIKLPKFSCHACSYTSTHTSQAFTKRKQIGRDALILRAPRERPAFKKRPISAILSLRKCIFMSWMKIFWDWVGELFSVPTSNFPSRDGNTGPLEIALHLCRLKFQSQALPKAFWVTKMAAFHFRRRARNCRTNMSFFLNKSHHHKWFRLGK